SSRTSPPGNAYRTPGCSRRSTKSTCASPIRPPESVAGGVRVNSLFLAEGCGTIIARLFAVLAALQIGTNKSMNQKRFKSLAASLGIGVALSVSLPLAAAPSKQPTVQEIGLYHRLPESKAAALKDLVDRFNAQGDKVRVVLSEQDWRAPSVPHLLILEGEEEE